MVALVVGMASPGPQLPAADPLPAPPALTRLVAADAPPTAATLSLGVERAPDGPRIRLVGPPSSANVALLQAPSLRELQEQPTRVAIRGLETGTALFPLPPETLAHPVTFFIARWEAAVTNPHPESLVWIAPGSFTLGSPESESGHSTDEAPTVAVQFTEGFFIGSHEVTQAEFRAVAGTNPSPVAGDRLPVLSVSWAEAVSFAEQLTQREQAAGMLPAGYAYRLPTEAEWEYAARAGTSTRFSHGADSGLTQLENVAWYALNSNAQPHPVGERSPNPWGLFDVHGNAAEWCLDFYAGYLGGHEVEPRGPANGEYHVIRGGSFADEAESCRSAYRLFEWVGERFDSVGFRLVLAPSLTNAPVQISPIDLLAIPAGDFVLGSPSSEVGHQFDESPQMPVTLRRDFFASRYEITQGQYVSLMETNPSVLATGQLRRPVENVSWEEAVEFCHRLTTRERAAGTLSADEEFRLPTEAEWEYLARAGTTNRYSFGDDFAGEILPLHAWYLTAGGTFNVGARAANPFGLFDLYGNVAEWCQDFAELYPGGPVVDPLGPSDSAYRVIRGGGYDDDGVYLRSACRWSVGEPQQRLGNVGFRVVRVSTTPLADPPREWVRVEPGTFRMGSPAAEPGRRLDEDPAHPVTLTQGFWIGKFEVTQREYLAVMGVNPARRPLYQNQPVQQVSWAEAKEYCQRLTVEATAAGTLPAGYVYRLPTEAEWEFAARAGTQTAYSFGTLDATHALVDYACFLSGPTCGVGSKLPNAWGLHDLHGNVAEWCEDWVGAYSADEVTDPTGPTTGALKVVRGGSWNTVAAECRSAARFGLLPEARDMAVGFRVVLGAALP